MKVSELIEELSKIDREKEIILVIEYFGGDYGEYNCEKRATLQDIKENRGKENGLVLSGHDWL